MAIFALQNTHQTAVRFALWRLDGVPIAGLVLGSLGAGLLIAGLPLWIKLASCPGQGPGKQPQAEAEAYCRARENARLGRLELQAGEAQRGDEQGHREADSAQASGADEPGPRRGVRELREAEPHDEPRREPDAERLADHEPDHHRAGDGVSHAAEADRDPRVREREQRHDREADPRMESMLQTLQR